MPTVTLQKRSLSGTVGMILRLRSMTTGAVANGAGGDVLTETGTTGFFSASVAESLTGTYSVEVESSGGAVLADGGLVNMNAAVPHVDDIGQLIHAANVNSILAGVIESDTFASGALADQSVMSVLEDVAGKVLGGGSGTLTGTGARVVDSAGNAVASASELAKVPKSDGSVAFNATAVAGIQSGLAESTDTEFLRKLLQADMYVDKTTTPWELVWVDYPTTGTGGAELMRKRLLDVDGGNVTSVETVIGVAVQ